MQDRSFSALNLSPEILKAVASLGFEEASPIQAAAIPLLRQGKDVVGQSQTGSGKTAAFAIPAIEAVDATKRTVQVLILCPTRELATQVADEVHKLSAYKRGVHAVPIYGGASYDRQFYELKKGVQIVIGTPGRLMDHLDRKTLSLAEIKMVILDEADRMLDMGFRDDIQCILDQAPAARQTAFFSATVSPQIQQLIKRYSRNPETIRMEQKAFTVPTVEQVYYEVPSRSKQESLIRLIDFHQYKLGIIFCNTQRMVDDLADTLQAQGISADRLHGGIPQAQRTRVMNKFKNAEFEFLVATDVAGRGIDVDDLEVVVNYDLPYDPEDYVHRIGRTGRAGREGMAVTFVSGREIYKIPQFERFTKMRIRRERIPTLDQIEERRVDIVFQQVESTLAEGGFKSQSAFVERLLDMGYSSTDIASALLHQLLGGESDLDSPGRKETIGKPAFKPAIPAPDTAKPSAAKSPARTPVKPTVNGPTSAIQAVSAPDPARTETTTTASVANIPPVIPTAEAIAPAASVKVSKTTKPVSAPKMEVVESTSTSSVADIATAITDASKEAPPTPAAPVKERKPTLSVSAQKEALPVSSNAMSPTMPPALETKTTESSMPAAPVKDPKSTAPGAKKSVFDRLGKPPKKPFEATAPRMQWVVLNAGRDAGMTPKEVVDMLAGESGLPPRTVGRIDLTDHAAYAQVAAEHVAKMAETVAQLEFDGRQLTLQTASYSGSEESAKSSKKPKKPFLK